MANVTGSVVRCSDDSNLAKFSALTASFGRSAFSPDYDPWMYTDTFGRSKIYKSLLASHQNAESAPKKASVHVESGDASSVADDSAVKASSSKKRKRMERNTSRFSASSFTVSPQPSSTRD